MVVRVYYDRSCALVYEECLSGRSSRPWQTSCPLSKSLFGKNGGGVTDMFGDYWGCILEGEGSVAKRAFGNRTRGVRMGDGVASGFWKWRGSLMSS